MKSLQRKNVLLFTFILAAVGATPVLGQTRVERADALLLRAKAAEELASHSANAEARADAARLHLESARLRPESDLQGIASLWTAGLYYAYEQPAEAARLIATAADRAHAMGDIVTAANAYLDAAAALVQAYPSKRMPTTEYARVQMWIGKAADLANSPHLPQAVRENLQRRIGPDEGHLAG